MPKFTRTKKNSSKAPFARKIKPCKFCTKKIEEVDYKDTRLLSEFLTERGKILSRQLNGSCAKHQRVLAKNIKRARNAGLLPFIVK